MKHWIVLLLVLALTAPAAFAQTPDLGTDEERAAGKEVYDKWCAQCHGENGDGQGIATPYLQPEPRDFTEGKYKVRSTPNGTLPTDADLVDVIRDGLPGTAMPAFPDLSATEVDHLVAYLKSFSDDFADPQAYGEPYDFPDPPPFSEDSLEVGFETYVEIGCARCHGELGRGDGNTAPTLRDDWGNFIRAADLTMPWTFRAGGSREAIFKTLTTGFNGTPMAGFADGLSEEQRWQIVDWIVAQADGQTEAPYGNLLTAVGTDADLDFAQGLETVRAAFDDAPATLFPLVGQIMEPGRAFHPSVVAVEVKAVYNPREIAFLVTWHDMKAETSGENGPDLVVPLEDETTGLPEAEDEAGGEAVETDIWGNPIGGSAAADAGAPPADPFAQDLGTAATAEVEDSPWSDAVAIQVPSELREGVTKPYFLLGDPQYPVHLWFVDLARPEIAQLWEGRGSRNLTLVEGAGPEVLTGYDRGEWAVAFKRPRRGTGVTFPEGEFVPIAFSVWDGFAHERGSKRGLTRWFHVFMEPLEAPPLVGPMLKAFVLVLLLELLIIAFVRWRKKKSAAREAAVPVAGQPATADS